MKNISILAMAVAAAITFSGCAGTKEGPENSVDTKSSQVSQQLLDLQRARNNNTITDIQYQEQKAQLLNTK